MASLPIGLMFWFDAGKTDPKPARLKQTFYNDLVYGSVQAKTAGTDDGEYRVLLEFSPNTWMTEL